MKIINRLLLLAITLIFMFIMLLLSIYSMGIVESDSLLRLVESFYSSLLPAILFLLAFIIGARAIYPFFKDTDWDNTAAIADGELGDVEITMEALKNMIRGVATQQDGVEEITTELKAGEDGVHILIKGKVLPSAIIPEVTSRLQRIVKSYIEDTTGVNVVDVKVLIENVYQEKGSNKKRKNTDDIG